MNAQKRQFMQSQNCIDEIVQTSLHHASENDSPHLVSMFESFKTMLSVFDVYRDTLPLSPLSLSSVLTSVNEMTE
jgi:hypothetical protein